LYISKNVLEDSIRKELRRDNDCIRKNSGDIEIKCIIRKVDNRFLGKRRQVEEESYYLGEKYFDYKDVIVSEYTRGRYLNY
jgi:hypothetical protein